MAFWGITVAAIFFGYKPPKRHTRLDGLTIMQKLGRLDLPGSGLVGSAVLIFTCSVSDVYYAVDCRFDSATGGFEFGRQPLAMEQCPRSRHTYRWMCDPGRLRGI